MQAKAHHHHHEDAYYWCGMKGHWSHTCHMSKHLVIFTKRRRKNGKNIEINFTYLDGENNITNLNISDFFVDSGEKLNFLNGDGFVPTD